MHATTPRRHLQTLFEHNYFATLNAGSRFSGHVSLQGKQSCTQSMPVCRLGAEHLTCELVNPAE